MLNLRINCIDNRFFNVFKYTINKLSYMYKKKRFMYNITNSPVLAKII